MDELKQRATEKIGALHEAAKTTADISKTKAHHFFHHSIEAFQKIRAAFLEVWHHELITESRHRITAWSRDAVQRIKEGTPPLSPVLLYEELVALFKDRVWRRSMLIFICGVAVGGSCGLALGLRVRARGPIGPHARALHTVADQTVILVEDAVTPGAATGEVLVRVQAFSVCPVDRCVLRGRGAGLRALLGRSSITVGRAFSGVVLDVGYGVNDLEMGDEVWGCVSEWAGGAASELLTIRSTRVSKRPRSVPADAAAALPWAGAEAMAALDTLRYNPHTAKGKRVLVCGSADGSACVLLQLLHWWDARVTAQAPSHAALALQDLGAQELVESNDAGDGGFGSWLALEQLAARRGPFDAVVAVGGTLPPAKRHNAAALLKATAPRDSVVELRPVPFWSDRLPPPFAFVFGASFYAVRFFRWLAGRGWHTDWLEENHRLREGLSTLTALVDAGHLVPVLDKVYLPQDFEAALAHACSDDALGTTVIRFP